MSGSVRGSRLTPYYSEKETGVYVSNQRLQLEVHAACCLGQACQPRYSDSLVWENDGQTWRLTALPHPLPSRRHLQLQPRRTVWECPLTGQCGG